jgi:hypothetical protein
MVMVTSLPSSRKCSPHHFDWKKHNGFDTFAQGRLWCPGGPAEPPGVGNTLFGVSRWSHIDKRKRDRQVTVFLQITILLGFLCSLNWTNSCTRGISHKLSMAHSSAVGFLFWSLSFSALWDTIYALADPQSCHMSLCSSREGNIRFFGDSYGMCVL